MAQRKASKMTQVVKYPAFMSLIPGILKVKGEKQLLQVSCVCTQEWGHTYSLTHK